MDFEIAFSNVKKATLKIPYSPGGFKEKVLKMGKNSVMVMSGILKAHHLAKFTLFGFRCRASIPSREGGH